MCKKMGLGQQALADAFDMKRGKVAGYFYETQPKPDFFEKLGRKFNLDIGKFLTDEMDEGNYNTFFTGKSANKNSETRSSEKHQSNSKVFDLLIDVKNAENANERSLQVDEIIKLLGMMLEENSRLKDELLEMARKLING